MFTSLIHRIDFDFLREAFYELRRDGAPGLSGVTVKDDEKDLEANLRDLQRRELQEAEQYARAAVAVDSESAEAWKVLGLVLFNRDNFNGARDALEHSLALNPNSDIWLRFLSLCYQKLGYDERSKEMYRRAVSLSGGEPQLPA